MGAFTFTPLKIITSLIFYPPRLKSAFSELDDPGEVFLAICAEDSSIVYYKLSMGIHKPPV